MSNRWHPYNDNHFDSLQSNSRVEYPHNERQHYTQQAIFYSRMRQQRNGCHQTHHRPNQPIYHHDHNSYDDFTRSTRALPRRLLIHRHYDKPSHSRQVYKELPQTLRRDAVNNKRPISSSYNNVPEKKRRIAHQQTNEAKSSQKDKPTTSRSVSPIPTQTVKTNPVTSTNVTSSPVIFVKEYNKNKITVHDSIVIISDSENECDESHEGETNQACCSSNQCDDDDPTLSPMLGSVRDKFFSAETSDSNCEDLPSTSEPVFESTVPLLQTTDQTPTQDQNEGCENVNSTLPSKKTTSLNKQPTKTVTPTSRVPVKQRLGKASNTSTSNVNKDTSLTSDQLQNFNMKIFGLTPVEIQTFFQNDKLSRQIYQFMMTNQQRSNFLQQKLRLAKALQDAIVYAMLPDAKVFLVGSSVNGFGRLNSDADLCLVFDPRNKTVNRKTVLKMLNRMKQLLNNAHFVKNLQLIYATVPILKFEDRISGMECDLNVNNLTGIRNSFLLLAYARCDPRVRPMVLCIKEWAHVNNINSAQLGTLSSYALVLMVLHYLQIVKPRVIPSFQALHKDNFSSNLPIHCLGEKVASLPMFYSNNTSPVSQLLKGWFNYFSTFDFANKVISVRLGTSYNVHTMSNSKAWLKKCVKIEEPFDQTNVARAVQSGKQFSQIITSIRNADIALRNDNLKTIIPCLAPSYNIRCFN
uniref:poly(A) RNA polymerase gld-2 isoform X2 n=1 Tax=Ciona intestinalis TaxID=7719 RepID=UPI0005219945|nr:poly(A) RNA polymerase gld-2 isoform X2 [Ciona intestinalis]|eukprot:XP_009862414.1 poly(A) RNA polymerase gld-2 isoform X2 [Ciona intestinalis]